MRAVPRRYYFAISSPCQYASHYFHFTNARAFFSMGFTGFRRRSRAAHGFKIRCRTTGLPRDAAVPTRPSATTKQGVDEDDFYDSSRAPTGALIRIVYCFRLGLKSARHYCRRCHASAYAQYHFLGALAMVAIVAPGPSSISSATLRLVSTIFASPRMKAPKPGQCTIVGRRRQQFWYRLTGRGTSPMATPALPRPRQNSSPTHA